MYLLYSVHQPIRSKPFGPRGWLYTDYRPLVCWQWVLPTRHNIENATNIQTMQAGNSDIFSTGPATQFAEALRYGRIGPRLCKSVDHERIYSIAVGRTLVCSNNSFLQAKEESISEVQVDIGLALLHTNTTTLSLTHCSVCLSRGVGGASSTIVLF